MILELFLPLLTVLTVYTRTHGLGFHHGELQPGRQVNLLDTSFESAFLFSKIRSSYHKQESLSENAEVALLEDIEAQKHGDAVYFWVRMDKDPRNPTLQDFWSFCDSINAGNCK